MKLVTRIVLLIAWMAPARATVVYAGFCPPCGGSERLIFSNQTPNGFELEGITSESGYEVLVTGDGQDLLSTRGGWSSVRPAGPGGFSQVSFSIPGAGFRELILNIHVLDDVPLTILVDGSELPVHLPLRDHGNNFINIHVPEGSLMGLVTLRVSGDYFVSLSHIRFGGIGDLEPLNGENPEPATVTLIMSGLAAICVWRRQARKRVMAADG